MRALADAERVRVVELLSEEPRRAGELASSLGVTPATMSKHLRVLLRAGVVADERPEHDATVRIFRLRRDSVAVLGAWLDRRPRSGRSPRSSTAGGCEGAHQPPRRGRALAMRCETGVGGRLLEVYDDASGDTLELARITAWEPGRRLGWRSSRYSRRGCAPFSVASHHRFEAASRPHSAELAVIADHDHFRSGGLRRGQQAQHRRVIGEAGLVGHDHAAGVQALPGVGRG